MRLAFAAALALMALPALAGSATSINVGLVVRGEFASALAGNWVSRAAPRGSIYHFVVNGGSGAFHQLVSAKRDAGTCDLRITGAIHSFEQTSGSSYEMQYSIQSADVVRSAATPGACKNVAASYMSDVAADGTRSLILRRTGDGRLIDSATGAEYSRTR